MKILVVDDNETNLKIIKLILEKDNYEVHTTHSPETVLEKLDIISPDIILLDINMPKISGYDLCREIKFNEKFADIPIMFISALSDAQDIVKGFHLGAVDYVTKPFKSEEDRARIATHLKLKELQKELREQNSILEKRVREQVAIITRTQTETIFSLAKLSQSRDDDTGKHLERVQSYCLVLALELQKNSGYKDEISDEFVDIIKLASPLHDIGKVGISDNILLKPGKLTDEEFAIMKTHTTIGYETLKEVHAKFGDNSFIETGMVIAKSHHERYDGFGYPDKVKGQEIALAARIMSIADVYDALTSNRVYKRAFNSDEAIDIMILEAEERFNPYIFEKFLGLVDYKKKPKIISGNNKAVS